MLVIKIEKGGKVTIQASGYPGPACAEVTAHYAKHMGEKTDDVPTEEMYETARPQHEAPQKRAEET
jgi:hypothetical protein